jgi:uncharacterized delta-60 repeat protein
MKKSVSILTILLTSAISVTTSAQQPGDLDPTFGTGGKVRTSIGPSGDSAYAVAIQTDGKIVAAGFSLNGPNFYFALARYDADGSLDASFGSGGKVTTAMVSDHLGASAVAIQSDGKIVAAGTVGYYPNHDFVVVRYNADGSLDTSFGAGGIVDTSFGAGGIVTTAIGPSQDIAHAIAIQSDGKIVVGGSSWNGSDADFALVRYNADASLDASFGSGGKVTTAIGALGDAAYAFAIRSDGKIVAAGQSWNGFNVDIALARYDPDGSLDASFGSGGKVTTTIGSNDDFAYALAIQSDGKIVAAGNSWTGSQNNADFACVRYDPNGSLDISFGLGGIVTTAIAEEDESSSLVIQSGGQIVAAGFSYSGGRADFTLVRYNPNGSLDTTFGGGDGISAVDFNNSQDLAHAMAIDSEGRAVIAGYSDDDFALARFLLEAKRASFDFDGDGRSDVSVFRPSEGNWFLQRSRDGFAAVNWGVGTDKIVPADYDGDGTTDLAVYRPSEGNWYVLRSSNGTLIAQTFGIFGDLPAPGDFDGDGKADITVYRPSTGTWWISRSGGRVISARFGTSEDRPVVGDYDGDGSADLGVFRPSNGTWYYSDDLIDPAHNFAAVPFGLSTDLVTPADFDADGRTDVAVYRPSTGVWYSLNSSNGALRAMQFGTSEDEPVAADFDGDGRADISVFRPSNGVWYRLNSGNGSFFAVQFGTTTDVPTPAAFRY